MKIISRTNNLTGITTATSYGLFTKDGLDNTVNTDKIARRELKDLKGMGCSAKAFKVTGKTYTDTENACDAIGELIRDFGCFPGKTRMAKVMKDFGVTITAVKA